MQTQGHASRAIVLLVAAVMVLSVGLGVISFAMGSSSSPAKTQGVAHAALPNVAAATAYLHQGMPSVKTVSTPGGVSHGTATAYNSYNWAGYADAVSSSAYGTITLAQGEWFVPTASCPTSGHSQGTYGATWVGIDGFSTGSVEQAGSFAYCSGPNVAPEYLVWWEFYPYNDVAFTSVINAGDLIYVSIAYNPSICYSATCGIYTINLEDFSEPAASFTIVSNPTTCNTGGYCETGVDGSAECISEAPGISSSYNGGIAQLVKQTPTTFYLCSDTIGSTFTGIGSHGTHATLAEITQLGYTSGLKDQTVNSLSTYYYGKSEFTVTWHHYD